jgi:hypothetical protein
VPGGAVDADTRLMADDVSAVSSNNNAAEIARRANEDAARTQAAQQAQKATPTGPAAAEKSRDEQAAAAVDNERGRDASRALGQQPVKATAPAAPDAKNGDIDGVYADAGASPPAKAGEAKADDDKRSVTIEGKQYDNTYDTGHKNADGSPVRVTSEEAKKLDDPQTRQQMSLDIGRRIAQDEGLTTALGGKDNRAAAEKKWNGMSGDEQAKLAGEQARGKSLTDAVYGAKSQSDREKIVEGIGDKAGVDVPNQHGFGATVANPVSDAATEKKAGEIARNLQDQAAVGQNGRSTLEQRAENTKHLAKEVVLTAASAPLGGPLARVGGKALELAGGLASKIAPKAIEAVAGAASKAADAVTGLFSRGATAEIKATEDAALGNGAKANAAEAKAAEAKAAEAKAAQAKGEQAKLKGDARENAAEASLKKSGFDVRRANLETHGTDIDLVMNSPQGYKAVQVGSDAKAMTAGKIDEGKVQTALDRFRRAQEAATDVDGPFRAQGAGAVMAFPKETNPAVVDRFAREIGARNILLF